MKGTTLWIVVLLVVLGWAFYKGTHSDPHQFDRPADQVGFKVVCNGQDCSVIHFPVSGRPSLVKNGLDPRRAADLSDQLNNVIVVAH